MTGARPSVTRVWVWLVALSLLGTVMALTLDAGATRAATGVALLGLTLVKARLILLYYLRLARAPFWRSGATMAMTIFLCLLAILYLAASLA